MSLPSGTKMWLTVQSCLGLPNVTHTTVSESASMIRNTAQKELDEAKKEFQAVCDKALQSDTSPTIEQLCKAMHRCRTAKEQYEATPKEGAESSERKLVPNPFVVVSLDKDDVDGRPMLYTKAERATMNPTWRKNFKEFPLETYLTGKRAFEMCENKTKDYQPKSLTFQVYHDNSVPDKEKPKPSDKTLRRDKPQRDVCIAEAKWDFSDVCRNVGSPEFEKVLNLCEPGSNKRIENALLGIKVRLCVPPCQPEAAENGTPLDS